MCKHQCLQINGWFVYIALEIENNQPFPETDFKGDIWTIEAK
jgi:hypothetical protein